jgi:hypothetical protein
MLLSSKILSCLLVASASKETLSKNEMLGWESVLNYVCMPIVCESEDTTIKEMYPNIITLNILSPK